MVEAHSRCNFALRLAFTDQAQHFRQQGLTLGRTFASATLGLDGPERGGVEVFPYPASARCRTRWR